MQPSRMKFRSVNRAQNKCALRSLEDGIARIAKALYVRGSVETRGVARRETNDKWRALMLGMAPDGAFPPP